MRNIPAFTFSIQESHLLVGLAAVYIFSVYIYLLFYCKLYGKCHEKDYEPSRGSLADYTHNLRKFYKRTLIFLLLLSPASVTWTLFYAFAPIYLVIGLLLFALRKEWKNIDIPQRRLYGSMVLVFFASLPLGWVITWVFVRIPV